MSLISNLLDGVLAIDSSAKAVEYNHCWYSWGDLAASIAKIRSCFAELSLGEDARIGIMIRNRPDELAAILASLSCDASIVSLNTLLPKERLLEDLSKLKLPVVVAEPDDLAASEIVDVLRAVGTAVIELQPCLAGARLLPGLDSIEGREIVYRAPGIIIEMLTSGTTGDPKRIPLKRKAFEQSLVSAMAYEKGRSVDDKPKLRSGVQLLSSPMTHIGGLWRAISAVLGGRKVCLIEKFSVEAWHDAVKRHRLKVASAVPAGLRMILDANLPREDLSSLVAITSGTAPLDPAIIKEFMERYQIPILQNYGATEAAGAVAGWSLKDFHKCWNKKIGSVGRFQPGVQGRVVDPETGAELPPGTMGVLEMKSEQFGNDDNWLRTTDLAVIDEDGYLFIRGRSDNAIIRGGFKVHPGDVVAVLEQHPAVSEAVVVGIPDKRLGAVPVAAVIVKKDSQGPSVAELQSYVKEKMLPYQVPVHFLFVDDFPRTSSMKPALPKVKELFADLIV